MKKLICIFAFAAVLAGCRKPEPEPDPIPVLDDFNVAEALYYGNYYDNGCDNYFVRLVSGRVDESLALVGAGHILNFDFNVPLGEGKGIPGGHYTALHAGNELYFTFVRGITNGDGYVSGSYLAEFAGNEELGNVFEVTDGFVDVSYAGNVCIMEGTIYLDGAVYDIYYEGGMTVTDCREPDPGPDPVDPEVPQNPVLNNLSEAAAINYGDFYECGADNWFIELFTPNYDKTGESVLLEIVSGNGERELPTGTFLITDDIKPGVAVFGWDSEGYVYGTWYCYDKVAHYGATEGSITISRKGTDYTITFDCYDSWEENSFRGSYTGRVDYYDPDNGTSSVASAPSRSICRVKPSSFGHGAKVVVADRRLSK